MRFPRPGGVCREDLHQNVLTGKISDLRSVEVFNPGSAYAEIWPRSLTPSRTEGEVPSSYGSSRGINEVLSDRRRSVSEDER